MSNIGRGNEFRNWIRLSYHSGIDAKILEAKLIISYSVTKSGLLSASVESSRTELL